MAKAIIPGSFDPITNGHLDIIKRAAGIFDEVYVVIFINPDKKYLFSMEERELFIELAVKECLADHKNIKVAYDDGYVVDFMKRHGIDVIVKGVRDEKDFTYEADMAKINKSLYEKAETLLLVSDEEYREISSTKVRELIIHRQSIKKFVPAPVERIISERYV